MIFDGIAFYWFLGVWSREGFQNLLNSKESVEGDLVGDY